MLSNHDVFWPCDFLDHDLPTSRIWTYGYNADVIGMFESNNKNSVTQHGRDFSVQLERDIQNEVRRIIQISPRASTEPRSGSPYIRGS